jgi:hypothetical protein
MFLKRIIITALVVVAAAVLAPAAFAMLDAAPDPSVHQDLRSPDARLAPPVYQDLRLPDARDAGRDVVVPQTPPVSAPAGRAAEVSGAEFSWLQVGLAAALALALIALGTGTMRRRRLATSA